MLYNDLVTSRPCMTLPTTTPKVSLMTTLATFSLEQYEKMVDAGVFEPREENHVELIRGEIQLMPPIGTSHCDAVDLFTEWSYRNLPAGEVRMRVQEPVRIETLDSEPEPDVVWAVRKSYNQAHPKPSDILLLVEVAEDSLAKDRGIKRELYAEAGIEDYWIVNLVHNSVEVCREPKGTQYTDVRTLTGNQEICPLAFPSVAFRPSVLFPS
jgi:Uma2 family endonuclease